jgi:hypothetical protein
MSNLPALPSNGDLVQTTASGLCPLCGADTAPGQEYCLECGERLTSAPVLTGDAVAQVLPFTRASWFWPAVVGFLIAGIATAVALGLPGKKAKVLNATAPFLTVKSPPTTKTTTVQATAPPRSTTPTKPVKPRQTAPIAWPAKTASAYTIVLVSLPSSGGKAAALAQAQRALSAGLSQVGVLDSATFATLHPGYFVVFSGIYDSASTAAGALSQAHENGFNAAYVRQVTR